MAQWLRRPTVETLVFTGSSPALAKKLFFAKKNSNTNTVHWEFCETWTTIGLQTE